MGRVGLDPEVRGTEERQVATFPLATSENFKDANGTQSSSSYSLKILIGFLLYDPKCFVKIGYGVVWCSGNWSQRTLWHRISIFKPTLRDYVARNVRRG